MSIDRLTRVNELLRREIGDGLFHVITEPDFDMSAVTITHVITSRNLKSARVLVSIRDHHGERQRMLDVLEENRPEIQRRINRDLKLKYTPRLSFELDLSLEKGDEVLGILSELERSEAEAEDERHTT